MVLLAGPRQCGETTLAKSLLDRTGEYLNWDIRRAVVSTASDIMGGTPVFPGTRVPVQTLLDYLEGGDTIDDFLVGFPSVTREHVVAFLERAATLAVHEAA
jgi:uncharacterized protein (DUF433 family)